jgi:7,8-dihydroneopterin aldolase/epimerase/oxygenase
MAQIVFRIERLALHARHGAKEAERSLGQRFFLDIVASAEVGEALVSDRLEDTVHYGDVIKAATRIFTAKSFNLIEAVAAAVADELLGLFPRIATISVTVHKPAAPVAAILDGISVTVERRRDG